MLRTEQIRAGRFQPRTAISDAGLEDLKASIKRSGVIEPVIVRPLAHGTYEVVAGERRLRATQALNIPEIPAIIRTLSDKETLEVSLIENIQRENLNPLEEAKGYERLLHEFGYTQEDVASAVGKDRATVSNLLRILALPQEIRQGLSEGRVTLGHAKALLSVEDTTKQLALYRHVLRSGLSVRQAEAGARADAGGARRRVRQADPHARTLEEELQRTLGTRVHIHGRKKGGRITIDYFSSEDLTRILHALGVQT
ncbi:MAG: ParB/RepB/Spo0J family partition protein [Candidatus Omnitrophica bacterium]|nr:ParB/RepB/Spo0J family partition protein [Candidatus Omnitrophota bacterium]